MDGRSRRLGPAATLGAMRRAASLLCLAGALLATLGLAPARAQSGGPVVEVPAAIAERARVPIERMVAIAP